MHDDVTLADGEGSGVERGATSEGRDNIGSTERTELAQGSDVDSHCRVEGDFNDGSRTRSYFFRPSTVIVNHVREMIDCGYFAEVSAHIPGEETILEPNGDDAIMFEEFSTAGLRKDASAPNVLRYIVDVSSAAPPAYP
jgi:hypothetical protein